MCFFTQTIVQNRLKVQQSSFFFGQMIGEKEVILAVFDLYKDYTRIPNFRFLDWNKKPYIFCIKKF